MVLLELVMALTVFTLVAFALVITLSTSMDAARKRNEIDTAMRGLENQLALLHAAQVLPQDKDLPDDGSGMTYHLVIEHAQMQDQKKQPLGGIYNVTVTVKWLSGREREDRSIGELIYQP